MSTIFKGVVVVFLASFLSAPFISSAAAFEVTNIAPGYTWTVFRILPFPAAAFEFDQEGNLYTTDAREFSTGMVNILKLHAPDYDSESVYASYPTDLRGVNGLDFDRNGNLFISEFEHPNFDPVFGGDAGYLRRIDEDGIVRDTVFFSDFRPAGIAAGSKKVVYFPGRKWSDPSFGNIYAIRVSKGIWEAVIEEKAATAIALDRKSVV